MTETWIDKAMELADEYADDHWLMDGLPRPENATAPSESARAALRAHLEAQIGQAVASPTVMAASRAAVKHWNEHDAWRGFGDVMMRLEEAIDAAMAQERGDSLIPTPPEKP